MSTYKSIDYVIKEIENWMRLSSLLHSGLKGALLDVLHNTQKDPSYNGLPRDPTDLYKELNTIHKNTLTSLKNKKRIISRVQWDNLFPATGKTKSESFDVTLITVLIIDCTNLQRPPTGWDCRKLLATDNSKSANVLRCREWRNYVHHTDPKDIDHVTFMKKWTEAGNIIQSLGYQFNTNQLMKISLDPRTSQEQQLVLKVLNDFCTIEVTQHDKSINEMQKFINEHHTKLDEHDCTIQTHQVKLDKQDDKLEMHRREILKLKNLIIQKQFEDASINDDDKLEMQERETLKQIIRRKSEDASVNINTTTFEKDNVPIQDADSLKDQEHCIPSTIITSTSTSEPPKHLETYADDITRENEPSDENVRNETIEMKKEPWEKFPNDIFKLNVHVFESNGKEEQTGFVVNDLRPWHRERLLIPLDMKLGIYPNWYLLGLEIYKDDKKKTKTLEDLYACYSGGGNTGWCFLDCLIKRDNLVTCTGFAKMASGLKRDDIYQSLKNESCFLKDLDDDKKRNLATMLNDRNVADWKLFAEKYDFTNNDIREIKQSIKEDDVYSPTERLLEWFVRDKVTLQQFEKACKNTNKLNNVASIIREIRLQLHKLNKAKSKDQ